jgi:hypothetical protein
VEFISAPAGAPKTPIKVLSKHYKARRRRRVVTGMLAALAIGSIAMSFVLLNDPAPHRATADASPASPEADRSVRAQSVAAAVRPVYRHSVVPGGVRSPEEIEHVIQRDQVVAAHYKGINPQLMRNERLQQPLLAHVSYRLGDKIYWTKKPVQLPKNEPVMTDGQTTIRERCGNLISMEPLAPASDEEPPLPSFDLLMDPMEFAWMRLDYTPPGVRRGTPAPGNPVPGSPTPALFSGPFSSPGAFGTPGLRSVEPPGGPSTRSVDPPDPPTETVNPVETPLPVPEPNTLTLFGLAGAAGVAHYLRKRSRARSRS